MRRTPSAWLAALTLALAVPAGGCAGSDPSGASAEPAIDAATAGLPSPTSTAGTTAVTTPPPAAEPVRTPRFGQTFRYGGGLVVTVSEPRPFRPSPWVERRPGDPMRFEIVIRNRTDEEWNPSQLHARVLTSFTPAVQIFDYDHHVVARPEERLPAGGTTTFSVGYWITDVSAVTMVLSPGFGYQEITIGE